jgi:hypothetical protein
MDKIVRADQMVERHSTNRGEVCLHQNNQMDRIEGRVAELQQRMYKAVKEKRKPSDSASGRLSRKFHLSVLSSKPEEN